jgi:hypothetical protein
MPVHVIASLTIKAVVRFEDYRRGRVVSGLPVIRPESLRWFSIDVLEADFWGSISGT